MKSNFDRRHSLLDDDRLSQALRSLPARTAPAGLTTSLRVLASRERQRAHRRGLSERFSDWKVRTRLWIDNLMRPLAVPFAGGVLSAVALFGIWLVPTYPQHIAASFAPSALTASGRVQAAMAVSSSDVIVDVFLDDDGKMIDYKVVSGSGILTDAALRTKLESMLPVTDYYPRAFGRVAAGRMRLSLVSSSIIVKG